MSAMIGAMLSVMFMGELRCFPDFNVHRLCSTVRYRTLRRVLNSFIALGAAFATVQASGAALKRRGPIRVWNRTQTGISSMNP
jgi:hypothetical protein